MDLSIFLTAPLYRRWHLHWGATKAEARAPLPGDHLVARARFRATRAITIDAPPEAVWPWLGVMLMELGDFAMLRRMLRGIKVRAESSGPASWSP